MGYAFVSEQRWRAIIVLMIALAPLFTATATACPYTSIFSFGDSLADTGNLYLSSHSPSHHYFFPPYGETYFHHPSGRCSDGRLVIDFIAESLGLPLVKPYLGIKYFGGSENWSAERGANFAVIGATALDFSFFHDRGFRIPTNYSLSVQLNWFKDLLPSLCNSSTHCHEVLGNSLFLVGEIGGNDFNYAFFQRQSIAEIKTYVPYVVNAIASAISVNCHEVLGNSLFLVGEIGGNDFNYAFLQRQRIAEIKTYVPYVVNAIASAISELIDLGARTLMIPGNLLPGCSAIYLTMYETIDKNQYDPYGCLKWLNEFAEYYNQKLQIEIHRLQGIHPYANIIYADYYNAALPFYQYPAKFGFTGLKICCGMGGPYNYNASADCGQAGVIACDDPSQYIGWDGVHLTEAAYRLIAKGLINGPYSLPQFNTLCFGNVSFGYFNS